MKRFFEEVKSVQHLAPASRAANTYDGTGVDASGYDAVAAIVDVGVIATNGTLDCKLQESNDDSTYTDISGAAITQLTEAGGGSNKQARIDVRLGGRAAGARKKYVRARLVTATAASLCAVQLHFYKAHVVPVAAQTPADVVV